MATYASLTQEQKDILAEFTKAVRGWAGEQARANNLAGAIDDNWNAVVFTIVNGLLVTFGRLPPFSATLGMMSMARGAAPSAFSVKPC